MTQTCVNNMKDVFQNTVQRHICKRFSEDVYPAAGLPLSYQPHIYYVHVVVCITRQHLSAVHISCKHGQHVTVMSSIYGFHCLYLAYIIRQGLT